MSGMLIAFIAAIYFTPVIVAICRNHANGGSILLINLLLGWTIVGWLVALCWASAGKTERDKREEREARQAMIALARKQG